MRILIVEDEQHLADSLAYLLRSKGFETDTVYDGESGADYAETGIYDLIINDAYIGNVLDRGLCSEKGVRQIHSALKDGGLYCLNIITAVTGYLSMPGLLETEIVSGYFKNVRLLQSEPRRDPSHRQNCLLLASEAELPDI